MHHKRFVEVKSRLDGRLSEQRARLYGYKALFILTTQTAHWFAERGFVAANIEQLPQSRRELYNHNRRSKVLIKAL